MTSIVVLPNGTCGLSFKGSPPFVQTVSPTSSVKNQVEVGMFVHGFVARKKDIVYSSIATATELGRLLQKHKNDVRVLVLSSKVDVVVNHSMTTTLTLPAGSLGVVFTGTRISDIRANSPLEHIAAEGMYVHALSAPGVQYMGIGSAEELKERLQQHNGEEPRKIVLSHRPNLQKPTIKMALPSGPLHLHFKDDHKSTPIVDKVNKNSPLVKRVTPGLKVISLEAPQRGPQKVIRMEHKFSAWELDKMLKLSEENSGRVMTLSREMPRGQQSKGRESEDASIYPTPEDVAVQIHRRATNEERLGRDTAAAPGNQVGHTVDFSMRTGLQGFASMEDAYHFDDFEGKPFMNRDFRFLEYKCDNSNAKDIVMQDGNKKICFLSDASEDEKHAFEVFAFHPRIKGSKGGMGEKKFGLLTYKWAMVHDRSWKDQIAQREIGVWNGKNYETKYVVRNLELSRHHLSVHHVGKEEILMAVLFRRDYTDDTDRHRWVASLAPGVDPCFMMCVTVCLDKLIVH